MAITPLPSAPLVTDDTATFNTKAFAWVDALDEFTTEANALAVEVNADATTAASASEAAEAALGAANYKGEWSSLTGALNIPASVSHDGSVWLLTQNLADVTSNEPGVDSPSAWLNLSSGGGSLLRVTVFTSSGTWTKGANTNYIVVEGVGGGASGGTTGTGTSAVGSGAAGGYAKKFIDTASITTETVTIGSGGAAVTVSNTSGNSGGQTSFGSHITCNGGDGWTYGSLYSAQGGTATGGDLNVQGSSGNIILQSYGGASGGDSYFGGSGAGTINGWASQLDATGYGSGGAARGSTLDGFASGAGKAGVVIVWEYA